MVTIELYCLAGHFHATPWDRQVNEGLVEWPPSPWRILRALLATWHMKARNEVGESVVQRLVEKLAGDLPRYRLPHAAQAHTRHYMPLFDGKTSKIFQSFIRLNAAEPIVVCWPDARLDELEREALQLLLNRLGYLGRAESWIEANLSDSTEAPGGFNSAPLGENPGHDEIVKFLAPIEPTSFAGWRNRIVERTGAQSESKAKRSKILATVPANLVEALSCDTTELTRLGWSQPPGSRWVEYTRPPIASAVVPRRAMRTQRTLPTVARFAVASSVPPRLTEALFEADKIHKYLVKYSDGHPVFTGCDEYGLPLSGHGHAFVLPESRDGHGHITHVTLYAGMGFDDRARQALERLRQVWGKDGHPLQLVLLGIGQPDDFAGTTIRNGACPLFLSSRTWRSRTPLVPTRHIKRRKDGTAKLDARGLEIGGPEHDLRRLLGERGLDPVVVEKVADTNLGKVTRWLAFRTDRQKGVAAAVEDMVLDSRLHSTVRYEAHSRSATARTLV